MSGHIVYDQVVLLVGPSNFGSTEVPFDLREGIFIFLEQGGPTNVTTRDPRTKREVLKRSWYCVGIGCASTVMETAIRISQACETEGLTFAGRRSTTPETYIRRVRNEIAKAISATLLARINVNIEAKVSFALEGKKSAMATEALSELERLGAQRLPGADEPNRWHLKVTSSLHNLVAYCRFQGLWDTPSWEHLQLVGPTAMIDSFLDHHRKVERETASA
jgi:hypothetical protein